MKCAFTSVYQTDRRTARKCYERLLNILLSKYLRLFLGNLLLHSYPDRVIASDAPRYKGDSLQYNILHFTDENGLPHNSINSICPDKMGFLWLATENGLVRFDGNDFKVYNESNTGISSSRFVCIRPGKGEDNLYAQTDRNQYLRVRQGNAVLLTGPPPLADNNIHADVQQNGPNPLYLAIGLPNIYKDNVSFRDCAIPISLDSSILIRRDSIFFCKGRQKKGLVRLNRHNPWGYFLIDRKLFYLDCTNRPLFFDKDSVKAVGLTGDILHNAAYRKGKTLPEIYWILGAEGVLLYLDKCLYSLHRSANNDLETRLILHDFDLKENNIISTYYDSIHERIFLGSLTKGLFVFRKKQFTPLESGNLQSDEIYYSQAVYAADRVLTPQGRLMGLSVKTETRDLIQRMNSNDRYSMTIDKAGCIWTKSKRWLYKFDKEGGKLIARWEFKEEITQIYTGIDGNLWIGTQYSGLYRIDRAAQNPRPVLFRKDPKDITYILQETADLLWVGTGRGLYCLNLARNTLDSVKGLAYKYIRSLYLRKPGELWITTAHDGIFSYIEEILTSFPLDKNRYLSAAHCIVEDNKGFFWVTTNKGLFQVSRQDLLSYALHVQHKVFYLYYGKDNGFNTNEFNGGCEPCAVELNNGYVSLPSLNGLVWFNPGKLKAELPEKELFIDGIEIDRQPVTEMETGRSWENDTIRLPRNFERLQLHVSTPYYGDKYNIGIEYALVRENKTPVWLPLDNTRNISQSSLPHGNYQLIIRKLNGFGKDNYSYRSLTLAVDRSFYETRLFYVILALLLAAATWLYTTLRLQYIKRKNQLLEQRITERTRVLQKTLTTLQVSEENMRRQTRIQERLITVITHDIKSPLRYTALGARKLFEELTRVRGADPAVKTAKMLYESGYRIYHLTDNLLQYIKLNARSGVIDFENVDLHALAEEKISIFRDMALAQSTILINEIATSFQVNSNGRLLGIIIHNLLDNATKITQKGTIKIEAFTQNRNWKIIIRDTGPGMAQEMVAWCNYYTDTPEPDKDERSFPWNTGVGLIMVKELAGLINGRLHVESRPGATVMTIHFKPPDET